MNPKIDRAKVVAWLLDKARDEEETAEHVRLDRSRSFYDRQVTSCSHRDRAKQHRDTAAAIERGDPDDFVPPNLKAR